MAKPGCGENTAETRYMADSRNRALEGDITAAVESLIGDETRVEARWAKGSALEQKAYKAWKDLKSLLVKTTMDNSRIAGEENYKYGDYLDLLRDFIQKQLKVVGSPATLFENANPHRIIAVNKLVTTLVGIQKTRWGKKLNMWERALLPTTVFAMRNDQFGQVYKYAVKAINIMENSRNASGTFKAKYNSIISNYIKYIENSLNTMTHVTPSVIFKHNKINSLGDIDENAENITEQGVTLKDKNGNVLTYFGTIDNGTQFVHLIYDWQTGEKKELHSSMINRDSINKAIIDKYANEFTNDIMEGQARNIVWHNVVKKEHRAEMFRIKRKREAKSNRSKDSDRGKQDFQKGIPEVHFIETEGVKLQYVILKDPGRGVESYSGYVVSAKIGDQYQEYFEARDPKNVLDIKQFKFLRDGWYKSKKNKVYGEIYWEREDERGQLDSGIVKDSAEQGWDFSNLTSLYLNTQPDAALTGYTITERTDIGNRYKMNTLGTTINEMRVLYSNIFSDLKNRAESLDKQLLDWLDTKNGKLVKTMSKYMKKADTEKTLRMVKDLFDVNNRIWVDQKGNIHTPNTHFTKVKENYFPRLYESVVVDEMLDDAIAGINERLRQQEPGSAEYDKLERMKKQFELTYFRRYERYMKDEISALEDELETNSSFDVSAGVLAERNIHMKHRSKWTDPAKRKKSGDVTTQYLDDTYYSLQKNQLMVDMLETINSLMVTSKAGVQPDIIDWLINRTKIAFNNPTAFGGFKGKKKTWDYSATKIADYLNKFFKGKKHFEPEDVHDYLLWTKGLFGMSLLGHNVGLTNRTQIVNNVIGWGWRAVGKSMKIVAGKDTTFTKEMVDAIVDKAGTDEITNMFMDVLSQGSEITLKDAGLLNIPGIPVQIPRKAFLDFFALLRTNRQKFIKDGIPAIDAKLEEIELAHKANQLRRLGLKEEIVKEKLREIKGGIWKYQAVMQPLIAEEKRSSDPEHIRNIRTLRELFIELLTLPKSENNRKIVEAKFRAIMGNVTDTRMKRMVAWKLSWWWDGLAPELFTMTEGERTMRKQTVISALLTAAEAGTFGHFDMTDTVDYEYNGKVVSVPKVFLSDEAVRIARNAVNNSMFGMSAIHLGEAFVGLGAHFGLYKAYPLQQMLHDYNIFKSWYSGDESGLQNIARLGKEVSNAAIAAVQGIKYNPNDPQRDHEALAVIRLLAYRTGMTIITMLLENLSIFRAIFRSPGMKQISYMIRGGENPVMGIALRLMINGLVWSFMDDDDWFEGKWYDITWDLARLFFPVFLTLPLQTVADWVD